VALLSWVKSATKGKRVSDYLLLITLLSGLVMGAVVVVDVGGRMLLRKGLFGSYSLEGLLVLLICFSSVAVSWRDGGFVRVDLFRRRLPERIQVVLDIFAILLGLGCCGALVWVSTEATIEAFSLGLRPPALSIPLWPWKLIIPVGTSFLCYEMIVRLIKNIRQLTHKRLGE
jgi:TRAP-type C4-dicarboxylate transport system permease small subunit